MIILSVGFNGSGLTSGVANTKLEKLRKVVQEVVNKSSLCYFRVTFPTPEHPLMTRGGYFCIFSLDLSIFNVDLLIYEIHE